MREWQKVVFVSIIELKFNSDFCDEAVITLDFDKNRPGTLDGYEFLLQVENNKRRAI